VIVQEISLPARLVLRLFGTCMKRVIEDAHDICASSQRAVQDNETSLQTTMSVERRLVPNGARLDLPPVAPIYTATEAPIAGSLILSSPVST